MERFVTRKRTRDMSHALTAKTNDGSVDENDEESTEVKLAILESRYPEHGQEVLLEALLSCNGSIAKAVGFFSAVDEVAEPSVKKLRSTARNPGYQSSLARYHDTDGRGTPHKALTKKGRTLHLFSPSDIAAHTPCSIIHNFLPADLSDEILRELVAEAPTYSRDTFKLFDRVVSSPHTFCFYVDNWDEAEQQKTEYIYNGGSVNDVRPTLPFMRRVSVLVQEAVNEEIQSRIRTHNPDQKKLKYQSPHLWIPNASFVNVYDGCKENVGYHADQLTYLGPRAVIGSLSLGVAREFRIRRVVPRNTDFDPEDRFSRKADEERADTEGQIAIHLPHNSLLVMHADMQEEWKHSIAPAQSIDPHPIAQNKRINITYRYYKPSLHPRYTPKCHCNVPSMLKCVQKQKETRGKYMWMCHAGYRPDGNSCSFFRWAEFDDDGNPPWWSSEKQEPLHAVTSGCARQQLDIPQTNDLPEKRSS